MPNGKTTIRDMVIRIDERTLNILGQLFNNSIKVIIVYRFTASAITSPVIFADILSIQNYLPNINISAAIAAGTQTTMPKNHL